jgi:hypothetical protein
MKNSHFSIWKVCFLAGLGSLLPFQASWSNVGDSYGFGSRSAALGGSTSSWGFDAFAPYSNPAGLAVRDARRIKLSAGLLYMDSAFPDIKNVVIENEHSSDKGPGSESTGNVENDYQPTFGQVFSLSAQIFPKFYHFSLGITGFMPIQQLAYIDTGETFIPEYVLYRARTQRPQFNFGFGLNPFSGFYIGGGLQLGYSLTSRADVFLQSGEGKSSTMRFSSSIKPKGVPYFGLLFAAPSHTPPEALSEDLGPLLTLGTVIRFPAQYSNYMTLSTGAKAFGDAALPFHFKAGSTLIYDPLTIEAATSLRYTRLTRLYLQMDFQRWSHFEAPALLIGDVGVGSCDSLEDGDECGIKIENTKAAAYDYQDIMIPRIGHELTLGTSTIRVGYFYRPSIFKDLPKEAGNYLDPPKHSASLGFGFDLGDFFDGVFSRAFQAKLDLHFNVQRLTTQTIKKSLGDETGNSEGRKIGAPGYEAGGWLYGGGANISFSF